MKSVYASMFDAFVRDRNIDYDDQYWSEEDIAAWDEKLETMKASGVLK